jgi:putative ABC transport system permease protein
MGATPSKAARSGIQKQIQLPWAKAFQISFKSIRMRFARSLITAGGILLGIAFYSSVQMSGVFVGIQHDITVQKTAAIKAGTYKPTPEETQQIAASAVNPAEEAASAKRLQWLSIMALIVCTVGIANAMLMSVTERYKEIGTMKCLGALDNFIVKLFFIEACLLGLIASALGFAVGWLLISLTHLVTGGLVMFGAQWASFSIMLMVRCTLIGTLLTFLATIFPAYQAAKMPPVAALRVEV